MSDETNNPVARDPEIKWEHSGHTIIFNAKAGHFTFGLQGYASLSEAKTAVDETVMFMLTGTSSGY